jgi:hypothetical protein
MIGSAEATTVRIADPAIGDLNNSSAGRRFIEAEVVDLDTGEIGPRLIVPLNRIQMLMEAECA